jgi:hypothetical protein
MTSTNSRTGLAKSAAKHLRKALDGATEGGEPYSTPEIVAAAHDILNLRRTFTRRDGLPDMTGSTYAYRRAIGEIMSATNCTTEERAKLQATLRYHVGNLLREHLSEDELQEYGLVQESPREASARARQHRGRIFQALSEEEPGMLTPEDGVERLIAATNLLANMDVDWASASDLQRRTAQNALKKLRGVTRSMTI